MEEPVITAGLLAPDPLGIREKQQMLRIVRPGIVLDFERHGLAAGNQVCGGHENVAPPGPGIVFDDVLDFFRALEVFEIIRHFQSRISRIVFKPVRRPPAFGLESPVWSENVVRVQLAGLGRVFWRGWGCCRGGWDPLGIERGRGKGIWV